MLGLAVGDMALAPSPTRLCQCLSGTQGRLLMTDRPIDAIAMPVCHACTEMEARSSIIGSAPQNGKRHPRMQSMESMERDHEEAPTEYLRFGLFQRTRKMAMLYASRLPRQNIGPGPKRWAGPRPKRNSDSDYKNPHAVTTRLINNEKVKKKV